jgi:hypothetical protein
MGFFDKLNTGVNVVLRLFTTLLWGAIAVAGFATGVWYVGVLAIAYLGYIWLLGGRWLIY